MNKTKKLLKWVSIALIIFGIFVGGVGLVTGGLDKIDFFYFRDLAESIELF